MTRRRMVLGGLILAVGLLAGFAIAAAWNAFRSPAPSPATSTAPARPAARAVRLVHAALGDDVTATQTVAAAAADVDKALSDLVQWVGSDSVGSDRDGVVEALVLTGSFGAPGVDGPATANRLFEILKNAPAGTPIYVVPGGRQLAATETLASALEADTGVILALQQRLLSNPAGPRAMIDLSECYRNAATDGSGCVARLPGRQVRLVGYPAYLLPPVAPAATPPATPPTTAPTPAEALATEQDQWRGIFAKAMALGAGGSTLLVAPLTTPVANHWAGANQATWMAIARGAGTALGVDAAGTRLRPAYEVDEPWTESGLEGRWLLTPPLLAPNAAGRGAAQGATAVTIAADGTLSREPFWYNPPALAFRGSAGASPAAAPAGLLERFLLRPVRYLWRLGEMLQPLPRASMFFIALLVAFLTVAAVWDIPPATTGTVTITTAAPAGTAQAGTTVTIPEALMQKWAPASLLQQNLTRTVLSGLGGLAVATLTLETVGQDNKSDAQAYYLVWFILWFLLFLFASSVVRGLVEGLRALAYVSRQQHLPSASGKQSGLDMRRLFAFLPSLSRLQWFGIVASDAFFNLIQGKNELQNTIWAGEIRNLHEDAVLAIDRVAEHIKAGMLECLTAKGIPQDPAPAGQPALPPLTPELADVRVAVSLLSDDGRSVYYVSWPIESSAKEFGPNSLAYIAVAGSATRWWSEGLADTAVLFDNTAGELTHLPKQPLTLKDYFAARARDYKSFIVFPIPSRPGDGVRRAGLHLSFKHKHALAVLWPDTAATPADCYARHAEILDSTPPELERLFRQSIHVIESVLRSFNEGVFKQAMRSRRRG